MDISRSGIGTAAWLLLPALLWLSWTPAWPQTFTPVPTSLPQVFASFTAWGDYDNDGNLDLAIIGTRDTVNYKALDPAKVIAGVFRNNGNGTFTDINAGLMPAHIGTVAWGDYDNDGYLDLLYGGVNPQGNQITRLYHNNGGSGTFTENTGTVFHSSSYGSVTWGDYNNDGWLDIVLTGVDLGPALQASQLYRNNRNGTFTLISTAGLQGVNGLSRISFGDYDNDGFDDILLCGRTTRDWLDPRSVTKLYHNNRGNGTFTEETRANFAQVAHGTTFFADFNNDGFLDVFVTGIVGPAYHDSTDPGFTPADTTVVYLSNSGSGSFTIAQTTPVINGTNQGSAAVADYDGDRRLDVYLIGYISSPGLFRGAGNGTLLRQSVVAPELAFGSVAWGDFSGDGYTDLIVSGTQVSIARDSTILLRNQSPGSSPFYGANLAPEAPAGLRATVTGSTALLSWDQAADDKTPAPLLTYALRVGTAPGLCDVVSPLAGTDGHRLVGAGGRSASTCWTLRSLPAGTYYWSVQAVDNGFAGSPFAPEGTFVVRPAFARTELSAGPAAGGTP